MPAIATVALGAYSAYSSNKSAKDSVAAQKKGAKNSTALQQAQYERGMQEVAPFKQLGVNALPQLAQAANDPVDPFAYRDSSKYLGEYFNSPEYQVLNSQATDQFLRSNSATGGIRNGNTNASLAEIAPTLGLSALNRVNQEDLNAYGINQSAKSDQFNRLYGVANLGMNAATGNQNAGSNFASAAGNNALAAGQAAANGSQQRNQAMTGFATDLATAYMGNKMGLYGSAAPAAGATINGYTGSAYDKWVQSQRSEV